MLATLQDLLCERWPWTVRILSYHHYSREYFLAVWRLRGHPFFSYSALCAKDL